MKLKSPFLIKLVARLLVTVMRLLFATLKKEISLANNDRNLSAYDPDIAARNLYCTWHDSLLFPVFMGKHPHSAALVSQHQDGSYLAEAMQLLGIVCVRGSSMRGAVQALRETLTITEKYHLTITPDGPRGPRREMKDGIVYLASKSGNPIVPLTVECSRAWRIKGRWTDLVVPMPFSRVKLILSEPIRVPKKVSREEIAAYTERVQQVMDNIYQAAEQPVPQRRAA